jgi:tryptophan synthase alpha chain
LVAAKRERLGVPIVLFSYFNPIHARGVEAFADQARSSGVDGLLCLDLPPEEARSELIPAMRENGVDTVFLLAPTSTKAREKQVVAASSGFVYYVSRTGVTGVKSELAEDLLREAKRLRRRVRLPLAVGFGISTPEQVETVSKVADGVVVGSALVRIVEESGSAPNLPRLIETEVRRLSSPLHAGRRKTGVEDRG